MAIVREKVENAGGQVSLETRVGTGTTFRIRLPVTLATFKGVLVLAGGETFVIPTLNLERIARVKADEIGTVEGRATIQLNGQVIALVSLAEVLELPASAAPAAGGFTEVVVLGASEKRVAFSVEAVLGEQEVLVKSLGKPLVRVRNIAGATVLGSGKPAVILDAADLLKSAATTGRRPLSSAVAAAMPDTARVRVLVADDSLTSRMLLKNILESAGYLVTTAVDGLDALTTLHNGEFDLLISDVEMPHLDGFELTAKVRADQRLAELPVVLVTALGSREHQERGVDAGANAYIVKSSFDQVSLLEVVRRLV
jgi:two-component system chemotaxis sensor kinase CheA